MFRRAGLIISKGQANFETLDECARDEDVRGKMFFLFLAKCQCVAEVAGARVGDAIFKQA